MLVLCKILWNACGARSRICVYDYVLCVQVTYCKTHVAHVVRSMCVTMCASKCDCVCMTMCASKCDCVCDYVSK